MRFSTLPAAVQLFSGNTEVQYITVEVQQFLNVDVWFITVNVHHFLNSILKFSTSHFWGSALLKVNLRFSTLLFWSSALFNGWLEVQHNSIEYKRLTWGSAHPSIKVERLGQLEVQHFTCCSSALFRQHWGSAHNSVEVQQFSNVNVVYNCWLTF